MQKVVKLLSALTIGLAAAGCSTTPTSLIATGSLPKTASATAKPTPIAKPVKAAKPTRMYVWAGFKEKDCSPAEPQMALAVTPTKGDVSFRPNETITIQHSASGKCVGQRVSGTAIYYTPKAGQDGLDRFTVAATTRSGKTVSRSFNVNIVQTPLPEQRDAQGGAP